MTKPKIKYSSRGTAFPQPNEFVLLIKKLNTDLYTTSFKTKVRIVELTRKNADTIEGLIQKDDTYLPFSEWISDHFGANAIMTDRDALFAVAREVDRDNSTNAWRYKKNRTAFNNMIEYIFDPSNNFFNRLNSGDETLPDEIVEQCGSGVKSLSSKLCHHLSNYLFGKDNYYKNDSVVRSMLLFYLDYYGIDHKSIKSINAVDNLTYNDYHNLLDELMYARNNMHNGTISRSELDHIIWYCYKSF